MPSWFEKKCSLSYFLIYQIKKKYNASILALFLWYVFSVWHVTKTKNIPFELTAQESMYYSKSQFQCTYSVSIFCIFDLYLFLIYRHEACLKAFNQMQKTVGMRLNNKPYDITVLYVTFFSNAILFNAAQSLDHYLPKHLQRRKLLTVIF